MPMISFDLMPNDLIYTEFPLYNNINHIQISRQWWGGGGGKRYNNSTKLTFPAYKELILNQYCAWRSLLSV